MGIEENIAKVKAITPRKAKKVKVLFNGDEVTSCATEETIFPTVNTETKESNQWHVILETAGESFIIGVTASSEDEAVFLGYETFEYARPDLYAKPHKIKAIKL